MKVFNAQYCVAVQVKVFRVTQPRLAPLLLQLHIITLLLSLSPCFDCFPVYVQIIRQRHVNYSKQSSMLLHTSLAFSTNK